MSEADIRTVSRAGRPTAAAAAALENHILDVAWQTALVHGVDVFSLDQVAHTARVSKRTIYTRFENKQDLIRGMIKRQISDFRAALRHGPCQSDIVETLAQHAFDAVRYMASAEGKMLARLIDDLEQAPQGSLSIRETSHRVACEGVDELLSDSAAKGLISVDDTWFAANFWLESLVGHAHLLSPDINECEIRSWACRHAALFVRSLIH